MSSIAAVSELVISSRAKGASGGNELSVSQGKILSTSPIGMSEGTRVMVADLLGNVPVKKTFLKKSKLELRKVIQVVMAYSLAFPKIQWQLRHNDKALIDLPGNQSRMLRVKKVLGDSLFGQMVPVSIDEGGIRLNGFVGQPSLTSKLTDKQFVFVNNRWVKSTMISKIVKDSYRGSIDARGYPVFVLEIELPIEQVDINIHPRKEEVKVYNLQNLYLLIDRAVGIAVKTQPVTYGFGEHESFGMKFRHGLLAEYKVQYSVKKIVGEITSIRDLYLLVPTTEGLLIVDQHALHERFLYDELKSLYQAKQKKLHSDLLKQSLVFDVSLSESKILEENLEVFRQLGFEIESFGANTYKLNRAPKLLADIDVLKIISEVIEDLVLGKTPSIVNTQIDRILASMACRMAVKAGDFLGQHKRKELIEKLLETDTPGTCPHGRPVCIGLSFGELDRLFKRH